MTIIVSKEHRNIMHYFHFIFLFATVAISYFSQLLK
ncbi:hypothetical protein SERIO_v1c10720 [Spiroplasma eriocheiris]|uniref:Uncharacterized protein n=1 Tax=Spiroplasma eriocheiris TaxID=315358 RepID=A0A0H3XJ64_9MOLU|nr:hypothetical protein SERIO_v1c10720 [Spiroplasma eriocheiris]